MRLPNDRMYMVPCHGGNDFTTPVWSQKPGGLRESKNMEVGVEQGYWSIKGYERHDGQPAPSAATFVYIPATITGTVAIGNTLEGATSGATGVVVALEDDAIVVSQVTGTFDEAAESLEVSSAEVATATSLPIEGFAETQRKFLEYRGAAADLYRDDIAAVPGSGPIRGVCRYNGVTYAWRNNAGGTALVMHKSSASGWQAVGLGREIAFTSGGTYEIEEGDTITGATSSATATVGRVIVTSGTWAGGDAAGRLILTAQTGTFQSENLDVDANNDVATIAGDSAAITLQPDGAVKTVIENFGGQTGTRRIYGCDGVNRGFEFDGTVYVPIVTGMATDAPGNVFAHKSHLFFAFGSSAQHSGTGDPYTWSPMFGAGEIAVGDTITGFTAESGSESGAALGILCRNSAHILYGNDDSDWVLIRLRKEVGAFENSIQDMGSTVMLDDRGFTMLRAVDAFGNFIPSTISQKVQPWIQERKQNITASCIVREKSQYRAFFSDNTAAFITFHNGKVLGITSVELDHKVTCIHSVEGTDGNEEIYFGSDDGFIYQMEKGTSFDGEDIDYYGVLQYSNCDTPRLNKSFKGASIEMAGSNYSEFSFGWELGYSSTAIHQPGHVSGSAEFSRPRWDLGNWEVGFWDGQSVAPQTFKLCGTAENISFIIAGRSAIFEPILISGVLVRYQPRRLLR